jgi:hypothetical protein
VVDDDYKATLEERGFTTWGPIDLVIVILISELARRADKLLGMEDIEYQLAQLPREGPELLPAPVPQL